MEELNYIAPAANPFTDPLGAVRQSVIANNQWSAEQAEKQMAFQREMSNTAHQREIADLKAAGLNPVLSARLGGASTPAGASASADTSGTSALTDIITLALESANSAAEAARAVAGSGGRRSLGTDQSAESLPEGVDQGTTTGAVLGAYQDEDGRWHFGKDAMANLKTFRDFAQGVAQFLPPGVRSAVTKGVGILYNNADNLLNAYNDTWTLTDEQANELEENRRRLAEDNEKNNSGYSEWDGSPGYGSHGRHGHH